MNKNINWNSIAAPLDIRNVYAPRNYIRKWKTYKRTDTGVGFWCELANGEPIEYFVDVITDDIIRLRMNPKGLKSGSSDMLVKMTTPPSKFDLIESEGLLTLVTARIRIEFPKNWQITAFDDPRPGFGNPFFSQRTDDRAYGPGFEVAPSGFDIGEDGKISIRESVSVTPGESFYGLGEKFTSLDKWNQEIPLWAVDSGNVSSYRSYKNIPFLMSSNGYGLFVHSSYPMLFRMGSESSITYSIHIDDSQLDLFLIYGPTLKQILASYCSLTGFAPVPPKWSFGFWISRAGYRSREQIETVVDEMRKRGFPCDVLHLDPFWMGSGPWSTYQWDEINFPNPREMMSELKAKGVRTCLWIHPYVPKGTSIYEEGKKLGYLVKNSKGSISSVMEAFSGEDHGAVDFTNPEACVWWQSKLQDLLDMGVAVFKTDFGEQSPIDAVYTDGRNGLEMHNIYPLLYNRTAFELTKKKFGRGLVWGRSAYAGSQRYPVQWGGDSYSTLDQLSTQLRALLGYGLSGVPFCSHDVGGFDYSPHFFDDRFEVDFQETNDETVKDSYPKDSEVYVRWMQVGVFSSHVRAHGKQEREPWAFGEEAERICKRYLNLRYRLIPYIYTQAVISTRTGLPMVRPMVLEFQNDPTTQRLDLQYMFGDNLLVAPVLTKENQVTAYFPEGTWTDFWTKELIKGNQWITVQAPLEKLPLYVRGGAILPFGPEMDFVSQKALDPLTIEIYDPRDMGSIEIFDEDEPSIQVKYQREPGSLIVTVGKTAGSLEIILYGVISKKAILNSHSLKVELIDNGCKVNLDGRAGSQIIFELE